MPSNNAAPGATAPQAWAILRRHARDMPKLDTLCRDEDRVSSLVTVVNSADGNHMLLVDISRQRITSETLHHLMRLGTARKLREYITQIAWGPNNPEHPMLPRRLRDHTKPEPMRDSQIPTMHMSMRVPPGQGFEMMDAKGNNVLIGIHHEWERIQRISESIRRGNLVGVTGHRIRDVVVVGRGVAVMALRFVYLALLKDQTSTIARFVDTSQRNRQQRRMKFLTSIDPIRAGAVAADLDPSATLVISIALNGDEETNIATKTLQSWLLQCLGDGRRRETILSKHMMLVTGNNKIAANSKPESVFLIPEHSRCEPFATFSAATLLPLSIVFGWSITQQFLAGAHEMDNHFVETNMRHNLPVLLALTDIWNSSCLQSPGRIVTPYTEAFAAYPAFCATLESQTCSHPSSKISCSSYVVDGGLHGAYDGASYQSSHILPTELFMPMDTQIATNVPRTIGASDVQSSQDALMCSMFAHADEMAFGTDSKRRSPFDDNYDRNESVGGNRPSTLVICNRCDAFICGQLIALAEHRSILKARLWDVDPFATKVGSSARGDRALSLRKQLQILMAHGEMEDGDGELNFSTKSILEHYSGMVQEQRLHRS